MNTSGSSPDEIPLPKKFRGGRPSSRQDEVFIERRRQLVGQWRLIEGLTEDQIVKRFAEQGVTVSRIMIVRDVAVCRKRFRHYYGNQKQFDPVQEVAELIARYKFIAMKSLRLTQGADRTETANLYRTAMVAQKDLSDLLFDCGFINRKLGSIFMYGRTDDDDKDRERIPEGTELQRLFDSITVTDAEIISEAEAAWLHGDLAAAEQKALPAKAEK